MHKTLGLHTSSQVEVVHCQNVTMHFAWGNIDPRFTAFFTDKHKTWNLLELPTPNYLILQAKFEKKFEIYQKNVHCWHWHQFFEP